MVALCRSLSKQTMGYSMPSSGSAVISWGVLPAACSRSTLAAPHRLLELRARDRPG